MATTTDVKNNFRFFIPIDKIEKGKDAKGKTVMRIAGVASTSSRDTDGEVLLPKGFDLSYMRKKGIINWEHQKDPLSVIGEVEKADVNKEGLHITGLLYPDNKKAQQAYKLAEILEKNSTSRRLGWSIEGKATKRDPLDQSKVEEAFLTNVALTISPKNPDSFVDIIKGNFHGWADGEQPPAIETIDADELIKGFSDTIINITRPDGVNVIVDNKYNVKIQKAKKKIEKDEEEMDEDSEEKALTTASGAAVIPEHVDGTPKNLLNGGPQPTSVKKANENESEESFLTEEEVIYRIMKSNSVIGFEKAQQIFQTLNTIAMQKTAKGTQISEDLLEKSLKMLGFEKSDKVKKGEKEEGGEEEEDDDETEENEQEEGKEVGKNKKKSVKKSTGSKKISKKYDSEDEYDDEEDEEEEDRDEEDNEDEKPEGSAKTKKKGMKKAINTRRATTTLRKSTFEDETLDLIKGIVEDGMETVTDEVGELKAMVKSLAVITKHSYDLCKSQADEIGELREQIEAFGDAPAGQRKSVRKAVDRDFQKGMSGEDTLEKSENGAVVVDVDRARTQVLNMMDTLTFKNGTMNEAMAKGMQLFESSGTMMPDIQKSIENEFKVKLVRNR